MWVCSCKLTNTLESHRKSLAICATEPAEPSVGSVGDAYDNALAETINGLYKTEVIRRRASWRTIDEVEIETLKWVDWFNHQRLLEPIGNIPPAEAEEACLMQT